MTGVATLLGGFALQVGETRYTPAPTKQHLLLAYLIYQGEWVSRTQLAALFWADVLEEQARTNLRQRLHAVRNVPWAKGLEVETHRLRWALPSDVADLKSAFEQQAWGNVVRLYKGQLLAGIEAPDAPLLEEWLGEEREGLEAAFRTSAVNHASELSDQGHHDDAAALLLRLLSTDPLAEDVLQTYMKEALLAGQRADALAHYDSFRSRLSAELGLAPLPETTRLAEGFSQTDALGERRAAPGTPSAPLWLQRPPRLIGRDSALNAVADAANTVVLLSGEPGIGKTHLAEEIAPDAFKLRFHEGLQNLPYAPLVEHIRSHLDSLPDLGPYLNDVARVVPEVAPGYLPEPLESDFAKARLFEGLVRYVHALTKTSTGRFALLLDDLQWADRASLEWLAYLAATSRMRVLGTFRQGEVGQGLKHTLNSLEAAGSVKVVKVGSLTKQDLSELLSDLGGETHASEDFLDWIRDKSGGNPFFALQMLRSLVESGGLATDEQGWRLDLASSPPPDGTSVLPDQVSALVRQRVARLGEASERVLGAASVVREGFDADTLSPLVALSELEIDRTLISAEQAGVIEEGRFVHDLLRESLYAAIPSRQRRLWHRQVAEGQSDPILAAEHWWQAGDMEQAVAGWLEGARSLSRRGLMQEAAEMLERALVHAPDHARVRAWLAHAYLHSARFDEAESEARKLLEAHAPDADKLWGTLTLTDLALRRGRSREAFLLAQQGIKLLRDVPESEWPPGVHASFAIMLSIGGENDAALKLLEPRLNGDGSDRIEYAYNLHAKGFVIQHFDRHEEARALYREGLGVAQQLGAHHLTVHLAAYMAITAMHIGDQDEVIPMCEAALELGSYQYTTLLKLGLADLYLYKRRYADALRLADEIVEANSDNNFVGHARAYQAQAVAGLGKDACAAVEAALSQLTRTDFPNTHALIASAALEFGSPQQKQRALAITNEISKNLLLLYYRERLDRALDKVQLSG